MKKRKIQTSDLLRKSESTAIDTLLSMDRTQRLLTMALAMPQVQLLFKKITKRKVVMCLNEKFLQWKQEAVLYREEKIRRITLRNKSAVVIQCCIRKFLAKRKVLKKRQEKFQREAKRKNESCIKIQCMVRRKLARSKVKRVREMRFKQSKDRCALLIQRVFRGYLGRGRVILLHRNKLIRQIRSWANGVSHNLLHVTGISHLDNFFLFLPLTTFFLSQISKRLNNKHYYKQ